MAASGEMVRYGRMLRKFRLLNRVNSQVRSKRYVKRASHNSFVEETNETIVECSNHPLKAKAVNACESERGPSEITGDFFGIESDYGVKEIKGSPTVSAVENFSYLLRKKPASDEKSAVEENVVLTSFGSIRLDVDNCVKIHGQHDKVYMEKMSSLQPEKYLFGKLKKANIRYNNSPKNSTNLQHESSLIDVKETSQDKFTASQFSTSSAANQPELRTHQSDDATLVPNSDSTWQNQNNIAQSIEGVEKSSYTEEKYFNKLKTKSTDQSMERSKYNNYSSMNPGNFTIQTTVNAAAATEEKHNYVDEQYFGQAENQCLDRHMENLNDNKYNLQSDTANIEYNSVHSLPTIDSKNNYFDEQYFGQLDEKEDKATQNQESINESNNFIEEHYFDKYDDKSLGSSNLSICSHQITEVPFSPNSVTLLQNTEEPCLSNTNITHSEISEDRNEINQKQEYVKSQGDDILPTQSVTANDSLNTNPFNHNKESENILYSGNEKDEHYGFLTVKERREYIVPNIEHPETAYDYVMKLRKEGTQKNEAKSSTTDGKNVSLGKEKLDSKGFFILKTQVQDFKHLNKDAIVTCLKNAILYNDNDIVVLSKPYGLVCSGGNTKSNGIDIQTCLPDLAQRIFKRAVDPKLFLVHSIDKETTGTLVLARTERMANLLSELFSQNQIKKIYWTLTRGVPDVPEGIIDIPIAEGIIDHRRRMALRPDDDATKFLAKPSKKAERAITHYNVISTKDNAALMEVKPETNIKHQIRIHLGFGLRCPILGDHKYSNLNKIAPQKLPDDMLRRLHIRQSKVRYVPMHLHLKTLVIPEILDGKNLFFHANLPYHFSTNLKKLKFKKK